MLSGAMSALRNPKAHANITISADESMRQIVFASMLMYKIDEAVRYSYYSQSKRYSNVSEYVIMETVMRNEAFSDNRS